MNAAKAERPLSGPSGNGPEATPDLSVENDPKATSAAPCDILGEGKSQGRSDHAVCKAPARRICLGQHGCAAGACGARRRKPEAIDRDFVRGRLSKARCALQGLARPSRTRLRG